MTGNELFKIIEKHKRGLPYADITFAKLNDITKERISMLLNIDFDFACFNDQVYGKCLYYLVNTSDLNETTLIAVLSLILSIKSTKIIDSFVRVAADHDASNFNSYYNDLYTIAGCLDEGIAECMADVAIEPTSQHRNHFLVMNLIANCSNVNVTRSIARVACDVDAINSDYFIEDIKLISKSSPNIVDYLDEIAINPNSLNSKYHRPDMKLIACCDSTSKAEYLVAIAVNEDSLASNHNKHMEMISKASDTQLEKLFTAGNVITVLDELITNNSVITSTSEELGIEIGYYDIVSFEMLKYLQDIRHLLPETEDILSSDLPIKSK